MRAPLLTIRNLAVRYDGNMAPVHALNGVDLDLAPGQALGLVGETGCGKSTLGLSIIGLLPPAGRVISGSIELDGRQIVGLPEPQLAALRGDQVATVLQDAAASLNPLFTVNQQIAMIVRKHSGLRRKEADHRVLELLERVELPEPSRTCRCYPHELSGGMQQRVCLAMALACGARLLIADEPTTGLDPTVQALILDLLHRLRLEEEVTLLLISHDLALVAALCERVAVLYAGRVVEEGPAQEVLHLPQHPYTRALLQAVPRPDSRRRRLDTPQGTIRTDTVVLEGCPFRPRCPSPVKACYAELPLLPPAANHRAACHLWTTKWDA